ncbi:MAG: class I SAM-dependent methyltransferase [Chloroflexi bacterium]|nr:class I SAM-dependent methyltransferase [Chloroflexota bacterium]
MTTTFSPDEVTQFEHAVWSRCAKRYMDTFGVLTSEAIPALLDAANISEGSRVLDVGTGPGNAAGAVQERGSVVIGIDFSTAMLAEARQHYPDIEFKEANAADLPFKDGEFDAVISNLAVHHLGRPQQFLTEARRVLHDGGKVAFTVWADPTKLAAFGLFFAAMENHADTAELPHGPLFGVSDFNAFHKLLQEAGFRDSSVRELDIAWRLSSMESYLNGFEDWANMDALPNTLRKAIEADVRKAADTFKHNGEYVIPNPVILVSATR